MDKELNIINPKLFAERVKKARGDLSQMEFAEKCNMSAQAISKYENADSAKGRMPSLENAVAIARAGGVSLDWLAGLVGDDQKATKLETKETLELKTYGDVFRVLEQLKQLSTLRVEASIEEVTDIGIRRINGLQSSGEVRRKAYRLTIRNKEAVEAQVTIEQIEGLKGQSEQMNEIGELAFAKFLEELDKKPLPKRMKSYEEEQLGIGDDGFPI